MTKTSLQTKKLVLGALFTALVIVFQLMGTYTAFFGPFSTAIGLIPIAIGAIMCGPAIGAWLGLVFGFVVLFCNSQIFLAVDIPGTVITVLSKGVLCGFAAGYVYKQLSKKNFYIASGAVALICPIVNTGVFLLCCYLFFLDDAAAIATGLNITDSGMALFYTLASANFLFELGLCVILSPIITRIVRYKLK